MSEWYEVGGGGSGAPKSGPFIRTLLLKDTAVDDDIGDNPPIIGAAIGQVSQLRRVSGVLRTAIDEDLVVRFRLQYPNGDLHTVGEFTVPSSTAVKTAVSFLAFDWPTLPDLAVLIPDVTASDGSKDKAGVAVFTLEYFGRGTGLPTADGLAWQGEFDDGTTYDVGDLTQEDGSTWISTEPDNVGNTPSSSPATWSLIALKGDVGAGVATGGTTGQKLAKASGADYDTEWVDDPDGTIAVEQAGVSVGTQPSLNFIAGAGISLTVINDTVNNRINIIIGNLETSVGAGWTTVESIGSVFSW